ncbi:hypothetical protein AK830_g9042 [Neonectria ditissima]|uniref:Uncharacterized protein n=1 Tax=Neonectria ditissima TaxID=78410 RepID=A0A0P7B6H6_9HYPO|nr:hypothetical protein AK830_g9042 [Neonectria ditissima]
MDTLRWLFGLQPRRVQPAKVDTDDVFPVHFFDDTKTYRSMIVTWTLRFNDVLDPDVLHNALDRLLETGDWRKLGGRLRLNADGKLILHVPRTFTPERPGVHFSRQVFETTIGEHPLGRQLPKATGTSPSVQSDLNRFRHFTAREDAPKTVEDLIYSDEPQLSVHVTSFTDATLVTILWPHTMSDAMGCAALIKAWGLMLAGREDDVPELQGARKDVLDGVADSDPDPQPFILDVKKLKGFSMLRFGLNFLWELVFGPAMKSQMLYLPSAFVSQLGHDAVRDLKAISGNSDPPFISEGDVLSAWATRMIATTRGQNRPLVIINAVDIRSRFPSVIQSTGTYIQNLAFATFTLFKAQEASDITLGEAAFKFRTDILQQITEPQMKALMRQVHGAGPDASPSMYGEANSLLMVVSNWSKANFFKTIDFSPAVVKSFPVDGDSPRPGMIVYQHSNLMVTSPMARNVFNILGKDLQGNYWVAGTFSQDWWAKLEEEVGKPF